LGVAHIALGPDCCSYGRRHEESAAAGGGVRGLVRRRRRVGLRSTRSAA
jgi:hypothetical protein